MCVLARFYPIFFIFPWMSSLFIFPWMSSWVASYYFVKMLRKFLLVISTYLLLQWGKCGYELIDIHLNPLRRRGEHTNHLKIQCPPVSLAVSTSISSPLFWMFLPFQSVFSVVFFSSSDFLIDFFSCFTCFLCGFVLTFPYLLLSLSLSPLLLVLLLQFYLLLLFFSFTSQ